MPPRPSRKKQPSVAGQLTRLAAGGVRKRGETGLVRARHSKITTRTRPIPLTMTNVNQLEKTQRFETKLVKNLGVAFAAMPRTKAGWTGLSPTVQNKKLHGGVLATLMLKEFYASTGRKGIQIAVFKNPASRSTSPRLATATNVQTHLYTIFNLHNMRENAVSDDGYFENINGYLYMGFDVNFIVPIDILDRAKRAGVVRGLSAPEKARFREAYSWLRQRTPRFVTTWVTGHNMSSNYNALATWQAYVNKKLYGGNEPHTLRISEKFFRPPGPVPKSRHTKRGRGPKPNSNGNSMSNGNSNNSARRRRRA